MTRLFIFFVSLVLLSAFSSLSQAQRRMVAEWEPAYGTLIRWPLGIPGNLVVELAADDSLYVLVETPGQQQQAINTFQSYGVNLDHCRFITANTYSHWTRDWGPHYVFDENGEAGIADPIFNGYPWVPGCNTLAVMASFDGSRGYEEDDAVNAVLAQVFGLPLVSLPAYLTGGNVMTDGHGIAFSTRQMLDENDPICDEACFMGMAQDLLGIHQYWIAENPEVYGIQHIDCYAKLIGEEKVLVKQVPAWHPEHACVEALAEFFGNQLTCHGRPYEVFRITSPSYSGNSVAAYTNSLILNKKVLVPLFNIPADEQALDTYRQAMPGYQVKGFTGSWYHYDALHCRTMGIFDPGMIVMWHKPPLEAPAGFPVVLRIKIDDRSETGLVADQLKLYWRQQGNMLWDNIPLAPTPQQDTFQAVLPSFPDGSFVEYYFSAADSSGRQEKSPRTAPGAFYRLEISDIVIGTRELRKETRIRVLPSAGGELHDILITPARSGVMTLEICDIRGVVVWSENLALAADQQASVQWPSHSKPPGLYILRAMISDERIVVKVIKR